jgi:cytochrome c biogenesis protein CcdA
MSSALQLDRRLRWSVYGAFALLFATGVVWLVADQLKGSLDGELWQATAANMLMVHGGAAMLTLLLLGALFPIHMARAWRGGLNQISGSIMVVCNALLILSAFGLLFGRRNAASLGERPAHSDGFCPASAHRRAHLAGPAAIEE